MEEKIYLPMINLTPTMRCNLRCRLCGVLVPQYEYRPHMKVVEFSETLKAVFAVVDRVGRLQITGGEPLMHEHLPVMIEACFEYAPQFGKLWIFTNGSMPITPQLTEILCKYKAHILVHVSDYGVKREITDAVIAVLKETGCEYRYLKYFGEQQYADGWVDQGDFVKHDREESELAHIFAQCSHVMRGGSWYVRGGQMHWCGRSIRGTELGKVPIRESDCLNIFDGTVQERREKLRKLMSADYILACDYCNGYYGTEDSSKRYPAGEQMQ